MAKQERVTETMTASEVRQRFAETINRVAKNETRVILEKNGVPVAGIVSLSDMDRLQQADEQDRRDWETLEALREPFLGVPWEELEREALKAVAEVRADRRAQNERRLAGTGE